LQPKARFGGPLLFKKRKLSARERAAKKKRHREFMTIFIKRPAFDSDDEPHFIWPRFPPRKIFEHPDAPLRGRYASVAATAGNPLTSPVPLFGTGRNY
jgi:hypothetical protein